MKAPRHGKIKCFAKVTELAVGEAEVKPGQEFAQQESTIPQYHGPLWLTPTQNHSFPLGMHLPPTDHMIWLELTTLPGSTVNHVT